MSNENKSEISALSQVPKAVSPSTERVEEARAPVIKEADVPLPPAVAPVDEPPSELPPPPPQNKTPVSLFGRMLQLVMPAIFEIGLKYCFGCKYILSSLQFLFAIIKCFHRMTSLHFSSWFLHFFKASFYHPYSLHVSVFN